MDVILAIHLSKSYVTFEVLYKKIIPALHIPGSLEGAIKLGWMLLIDKIWEMNYSDLRQV